MPAVIVATPGAGSRPLQAAHNVPTRLAPTGIGNGDMAVMEGGRLGATVPSAAGGHGLGSVSALVEALQQPATAADLQAAAASGEDPAALSDAEAPESALIHAAEVRKRMRSFSHISPKGSPSRTGFSARRVVAHIGTSHRNRHQNVESAKESTSVSRNASRGVDRVHPARTKNRRGNDASLPDQKSSPAPGLSKLPKEAYPGIPQSNANPDAARPQLAPVCLSVSGLVQTTRDMLQLRSTRRNLPFCIGADSANHLSGTYTHHTHQSVALGKAHPQAPWMVLHLQPQALAPSMDGLHIHKYPDLAAMSGNGPVQTEALDADVLFSAFTLSAVPAAELQAQGIDGQRILPRNSFKLVQHREMGGRLHTHLVWFVHRAQADSVAIKGGFLPVHVGPASYKVHDPHTGMSFESDNLLDFIDGLERVSGTKLRVDADDPLGLVPRRRTEADIPLLPLDNLFVVLEAAQPDTPTDAVHHNRDVGFFDAERFSLPDRGAEGWLYRNSFALKGDRLVFRDKAGHMGTLQLQVTASDTRRYQVLAHGQHDRAFIRAHGLRSGVDYSARELRDILQNYGLLWMPASDDETVDVPVGVVLFQWHKQATDVTPEVA